MNQILMDIYYFIIKGSLLIVVIELNLLFLLSFLWTFYLILSLKNISKTISYYISIRGQLSHFKWTVLIKNCRLQTVRNRFLLAICISECGFIIALYFALVDSLFELHSPRSFSFGDWQPMLRSHNLFQGYDSLEFQIRMFLCLFFVMFLGVYCLSRILIESLSNCYSHYPIQYNIKRKLLQLTFILSIVYILGLVPLLTIPFFISFISVMIIEFVKFSVSSKQLRENLYTRYFDAYFFENQSKSVILYYKRAYMHFKIASTFLGASFFFHLLSCSILMFHSLVMLILTNPYSFLDIILSGGKDRGNDILPFSYHQAITCYDTFVSMFEPVFMALGWMLLIAPYLLVSIGLLLSKLKTNIGQYRVFGGLGALA